MIYNLCIESKKEEVGKFLENNKFKKYKNYWALGNLSISDYSSILDEKTGKVTLRLETPTLRKYDLEMKERGFEPGKTTNTNLTSLESLIKELTSNNVLKAMDTMTKRYNQR